MRDYWHLASNINISSREPYIRDGIAYLLTQSGSVMIMDAEYLYLLGGRWVRENQCGYAAVRVGGKSALVHRLILRHLYTKAQPYTDHKDHNRLNNLIENLRPCDKQQNSRNRKYSDSASVYKGVHRHSSHHSWTARIQTDVERIYIGIFQTEEEAARAYDLAAVKYFGEFAVLNFPAQLREYEEKLACGAKIIQTHEEKFTSAVKGVMFVKRIGKWVSYDDRTYIGSFNSETEAIIALTAYKECS
jgi:hypothetical protein